MCTYIHIFPHVRTHVSSFARLDLACACVQARASARHASLRQGKRKSRIGGVIGVAAAVVGASAGDRRGATFGPFGRARTASEGGAVVIVTIIIIIIFIFTGGIITIAVVVIIIIVIFKTIITIIMFVIVVIILFDVISAIIIFVLS